MCGPSSWCARSSRLGSLPALAREVPAHIAAKDGDLYCHHRWGAVRADATGEALDDQAMQVARTTVRELIRTREWEVREDNPARESLAHALAMLDRLEQNDVAGKLDTYADTCCEPRHERSCRTPQA